MFQGLAHLIGMVVVIGGTFWLAGKAALKVESIWRSRAGETAFGPSYGEIAGLAIGGSIIAIAAYFFAW